MDGLWLEDLPVYFIYSFLFGVGAEGKFLFFFSSVSKFEGCRTEKTTTNKWTTTGSPEKAIWKKPRNMEATLPHPCKPIKGCFTVSPDDEEIFELGALADQKESGCVWV